MVRMPSAAHMVMPALTPRVPRPAAHGILCPRACRACSYIYTFYIYTFCSHRDARDGVMGKGDAEELLELVRVLGLVNGWGLG